MAQMLQDLIYSLGNCLNCFPGAPTLKINSRNFKIQRLLGEGGFSYVYLVEDTSTHTLHALKKIRCPFGAESVAQAMHEVEAYRLFDHIPTIISATDHCVATERGAAPSGNIGSSPSDDGTNKTVYIVLPYYKRGNLQDLINANLVNHTQFPERRLMYLFLGVCKALRAMHRYKPAPAERMQMGSEHDVMTNRRHGDGREEEGEVSRGLMEGEGSAIAGGGKIKSYAHRDIKPGNIMIDDTGSTPILMDLGSLAPSPTPITSQSHALQVADTAAEHSTLPFRAPELFDPQTGMTIDTKVDIWSLGCTLFACSVGKTPFEMRSDETGGTLSLCIQGGDRRFPDEGKGKRREVSNARAQGSQSQEEGVRISEPIKEVVRRCLTVEPEERPDVDELIEMVEGVIEELPEDEA